MTTPDAPPVTMALPDLRAVPLDEMASLERAALDEVLKRAGLPDEETPAEEIVVPAGEFSSSI